ncbi:hypothetical protein CIK05_09865 [Bdellovibrio sp. qaytius]|nr:hypothetical protein CIK05_09865 [Bdellovibrio sp. qaytius]
MFKLKTTLVIALAIFASSFAQATELKEWTFLVFINGHNNLSSFADMNIKDMEKTGSSDKVNVVVEWGSTSSKMTKRLLVLKSTNPSKVTSPSVMEMPNHDMGDYRNLVDFVNWGVKTYPAKHYFVAVWNHGSGWHRSSLPVSARDISFDDNTGNSISTEQLGLAMQESAKIIGHNVDIYGSDACLMQMVEVASEFKGSVDIMVGSQETEPGEGWPYAPFIKQWVAKPTMTSAEVGVLLSKEYQKAYAGGVYGNKPGTTFSATDLSKLPALYASLTTLQNSLRGLDTAQFAQVKTAINNSINFYYSDYVDLGDFLSKTQSLDFSRGINGLSQTQTALKQVVLSTDNGSTYKGASGLSIWLPTYTSSELNRYDNLEFSKITGWNELVRQVVR